MHMRLALCCAFCINIRRNTDLCMQANTSKQQMFAAADLYTSLKVCGIYLFFLQPCTVLQIQKDMKYIITLNFKIVFRV